MLNEIFSKYRNDDNNEDLKDNIESDNDDNKIENQKSSDFLNEKDLLTYKKKSADIMSKYCTLYSKDNAVKPLNENF